MNYPVLVLEGSGRAADFICKGYRLSTIKTSEDKGVLADTFLFEMTEAAKYLFGFDDEKKISEKGFIHVHSINDTTHSFDKAIQNILFELFCTEQTCLTTFRQQKDVGIIEHKLKYVDLWDRPDIAAKEVFNLENSSVLQTLQQFKQQGEMNIVKRVNGIVTKILGSRECKPFQKNEDNTGLNEKTYKIRDEDIFKHLFIWSVIMDRREQYEDLAYSVMTELYCKDKNKARTLLMTEVEGYNYTTILEIAEKFTLMKFMGHAACQTRLDKIWKGEKLSYTSNVKVNDNKIESTESTGTSQDEKQWPNWMIIYYFYNSPRIKFVFHLVSLTIVLDTNHMF
ncbi:unnamed protein product [Mytilus edulis]|uniref:Uncharacterized protein n=1 Tax=Mytilus edulis TaxID=6550 RepID=A0A8S3VKJ5_MYTED|nr:unnamed protein product [Mytilus edulis]